MANSAHVSRMPASTPQQRGPVVSRPCNHLGNGGDLLDPVLVGGQVALEGLVLLLEGLDLVEAALAEVLALQHLLFAPGPLLVDVSLVLELLGEVVQPLQPAPAQRAQTCPPP